MPQTANTDCIANLDLIGKQNDAFRKAVCLGVVPTQAIPGRAVTTHAVHLEGEAFLQKALQAVGAFDTFEEENDPDGTHDFGAFDIEGKRLFWKIDLFEAGSNQRWGAETPHDTNRTERVLTIMLASDW